MNPTNLIDLWERYFEQGERGARIAHYPSEIMDCKRKIVWNWLAEPKSNPMTGGDWWPMKIGNAIHNLIQDAMMDIATSQDLINAVAWPGFSIDAEVRSGNVAIKGLKYPIRYRLDLMFVDRDGAVAGCELKTMYGRASANIKEKGPKDSALMQAIIYITLAGISRFYIPYVSRDNSDRVLFILDQVPEGFLLRKMFPSGDMTTMRRISPTVVDHAYERLQEIEMAVELKEVPARPFIMAIKNGEMRPQGFQKASIKYKGDWQCAYCQYSNKCWASECERLQFGDNADEIAARKSEDDDE